MDTQFFCSNASSSLTVTLSMSALPPGRYAVVLADAVGAPLAGQVGLILAWDGAAKEWKLAGLTIRHGIFDGHDGVWYWVRGRSLAKADPWSAWFSYDAARFLLLPVDFLSSPNLEKLRQEQALIMPSPQSAFPLSLPDGDRTWKIEAVGFDPSLREADLGCGVSVDRRDRSGGAAHRGDGGAERVFEGAAGDPRQLSRAVGVCGEGWQADGGDGTADGADTVRATEQARSQWPAADPRNYKLQATGYELGVMNASID